MLGRGEGTSREVRAAMVVWKEIQLTCFHKRDQNSRQCQQDETKDLGVGHCLLRECSDSLKPLMRKQLFLELMKTLSN